MDSLSQILKLSPQSIRALKNTGDDGIETTEEETKEALRRVLNITSWNNTFENFKPAKGTLESFKAFKTMAQEKASWCFLLNYGKAGCGKTHLCEAVSIELLTRSLKEYPNIYPPKVRVWEWSEILRTLKKAMRQNNGSYDQLFEGFQKASKLIIDDVGMGSGDSLWSWGELEDIVNYRYKQGKFTIITTNLDLTELPDRVVSRAKDAIKGRCILNEGTDYRPLKKVENV